MAASSAGTYRSCAGVVCLLQPHARPAWFEHVRRSLHCRNRNRMELFPLFDVVAMSWRPDCKAKAAQSGRQTVQDYSTYKARACQLYNLPHSQYQSWRPSSHQYPASSSRCSNPSALSLASSPPSSTPRTLSKDNYPRHPRLLYGQQLPLGCWPSSSAIFTACLEW